MPQCEQKTPQQPPSPVLVPSLVPFQQVTESCLHTAQQHDGGDAEEKYR